MIYDFSTINAEIRAQQIAVAQVAKTVRDQGLSEAEQRKWLAKVGILQAIMELGSDRDKVIAYCQYRLTRG